MISRVDLSKLTIELLSVEEVHGDTLTDLEELINSVYAVAEAEFWVTGYKRTNAEALLKAVQNSEVIGAKWKGDIIACVHLIVEGDGVAKFGMLSVPPKYEGNGIGGKLVKAAERYAFDSGCRKMKLELLTSKEWEHDGKQQLHEWYTRLGYVFIKQFLFEEVAPLEVQHLRTTCFFNIYEKEIAHGGH
ncbi:MAG TPA: GNAT family N-acetyltransferase [Flavobacteriales bacterium]|nr:GNAT family N-acetyltransferase [Flavobacteriales bacterium]HIO68638.1 GNAT family N-acetyltransferase [Flavobacteriales bacterium]